MRASSCECLGWLLVRQQLKRMLLLIEFKLYKWFMKHQTKASDDFRLALEKKNRRECGGDMVRWTWLMIYNNIKNGSYINEQYGAIRRY